MKIEHTQEIDAGGGGGGRWCKQCQWPQLVGRETTGPFLKTKLVEVWPVELTVPPSPKINESAFPFPSPEKLGKDLIGVDAQPPANEEDGGR